KNGYQGRLLGAAGHLVPAGRTRARAHSAQAGVGRCPHWRLVGVEPDSVRLPCDECRPETGRCRSEARRAAEKPGLWSERGGVDANLFGRTRVRESRELIRERSGPGLDAGSRVEMRCWRSAVRCRVLAVGLRLLPDPITSIGDWEQRRPWNSLQPLPFPYSNLFRPKNLIDSPECKFSLLRCAFKGGYSAV